MPKKKSKLKRKKRKSSKVKRRKRIIKSKKIKKTEGPKEVIYKVKNDWVKKAIVNKSEYEKKYKQSIKDNEGFWKKEGKRITWIKPYSKMRAVQIFALSSSFLGFAHSVRHF